MVISDALTCPKCGKEQFYIVTDADLRKCHISSAHKPQIPIMSLFGKIDIPYRFGHWLWHAMLKLELKPWKVIREFLRCPYCGFQETYSYWECRSIDAFLERRGVIYFSDLLKE